MTWTAPSVSQARCSSSLATDSDTEAKKSSSEFLVGGWSDLPGICPLVQVVVTPLVATTCRQASHFSATVAALATTSLG